MLENIIKILAVGLLISALVFVWSIDKLIEEKGGVKQTIINIGKEIKDIGREIGKG